MFPEPSQRGSLIPSLGNFWSQYSPLTALDPSGRDLTHLREWFLYPYSLADSDGSLAGTLTHGEAKVAIVLDDFVMRYVGLEDGLIKKSHMPQQSLKMGSVVA